MLENETLLSAFFIVIAAIIARIFYDASLLLEQKLNNLLKLVYGIFAQVGWPNIGPAATRPARPVPTDLQRWRRRLSHSRTLPAFN